VEAQAHASAPESERRVEVPPFAQALAPRGRNALAGLWRAAIGGNAGVVAKARCSRNCRYAAPALFIAALLGVTYRMATAPEVEASTAGLIEAGASSQRRAGKRGVDRPYRRTGGIRRQGTSAESSKAPAAPQADAEPRKPRRPRR